MSLILIRHGQTQWNAQRRIQGWLDSPLTEQALQQLLTLPLPACHLPLLFCSDLARAYHSAQLLGKRLGLKPSVDVRLRERCFGELQGEVIDQNQHLSEQWRVYQQRYQRQMQGVAGLESEADFAARIHSFLISLAPFAEQHDIIIVGHGEWLRALSNILRGQCSWAEGQGIGSNGIVQRLDFPIQHSGLQCSA
ncbi:MULTISPECIES: histidine phosphatase family protein [unclassified Agarivorans]|uniref:histidine phosphatase family protein n=1 Tax=unclassified Agarivorans TaxID=2636026 RepID=UPI003D7EB68B